MAFIPFRKSPKCVVTDDLFLEVTWEDGKSPDDDSELLGIIEGLDQQYLDTFQYAIEESLPYMTFLQAELLFQALQEAYGKFQLKRVAICHLEGKEAVSEGEVFASSFIIDQRHENLLLPLIQSIMTEPDFQSYTYQEKREYFVNQIYPVYKKSLRIQESALPLFPEEGEPVSSVLPQQKLVPSHSIAAPSVEQKAPKEPSLKKVYILMGLLATLVLGGMISSVISHAQLSKQKEQVTYLYQELKDTQNLVDKEHQIDVFSRYFLPNYYSGKKENLKDFLSDGDAKYTVPKEGTLQSVILEKLTYDSKTKEYTVTYVLSVKEGDKASSIRLRFSVKTSKSSKYGYVITTEPKESDYLKTKE
ncbi:MULTISPECIES: hypothetical protein [unclassified Streptococcus]|uniref:hypothetical protein n=1 Tax=unclassified Streptococcus TaxID=2608887 RepID=UPI001072894D|nr:MULTISPECIES: hypothetical protein [unclassified Streptococcus]MBF0786948.1 hypothetical protein [Streptococcus sp. 19428wC2_LYSM12]MCQ9211492.1 hypothetical protein [Streptococcus sp. B01]MCQ9214808.1 hypothetical protein [Streptococcus sp. O1]TFV06147.1 hypothetical protein E4T79_03370 [Streptococcus sp. LYSM12]